MSEKVSRQSNKQTMGEMQKSSSNRLQSARDSSEMQETNKEVAQSKSTSLLGKQVSSAANLVPSQGANTTGIQRLQNSSLTQGGQSSRRSHTQASQVKEEMHPTPSGPNMHSTEQYASNYSNERDDQVKQNQAHSSQNLIQNAVSQYQDPDQYQDHQYAEYGENGYGQYYEGQDYNQEYYGQNTG